MFYSLIDGLGMGLGFSFALVVISTFREVLESVEVGIEFAGGRATVSARFALEVLDTIFNNKDSKN